MNQPAWDFDRCPKCSQQSSVELDGATRLCLACRHEWNSATTTGPLTTPTAPALAVVPDVPTAPEYVKGLDSFDDYLHEARSRLLGAKAVYHEAGAEGIISEVTDDGYAILTFGSGFYVELLPNEFTVVEADVIPDDKITALATTDMSIAAQVLRAASATIETVGEVRRLTLPPGDWLPDEPGVMPVVEHGAAYAVAIVALECGVSSEQLVSMADMLDNAATAAEGAN